MKQYKGKGGVAVDTAKKPELAARNEEEEKKSEKKSAVGAWHGKIKQYKGEGKGGSYGVAVDTYKKPELAARNNAIPLALPANTRADVQRMFDSGYIKFPETPFWEGRNIWDVDTGTHCL